MTISMYKTSVPIFVQFLTSLSAVLDKAAAHAEAKKMDARVKPAHDDLALDSRLHGSERKRCQLCSSLP